MSVFSFKTIKEPIENILLKEKGSKFIGFAEPVSREDEFKNFLSEIKKQHPKATHHCYAYRFGAEGDEFRANDDGEPHGSAGLPIYNQILAKDLTDVCVVVVRYYGGTKLGVSGLVKAYKSCAQQTLELSEIIIKEIKITLLIKFEFNLQNVIFKLLNKFGGVIISFETDKLCVLVAEIKISEEKDLCKKLSELLNVSFEKI